MSDSEHLEDQPELDTPVVDAPVKAAKKPVSDRTKSTLFIRNLPFTATNKEFEAFFSEFGPIKACFVVTEHRDKKDEKDASVEGAAEAEEEPVSAEGGKSKGFGFVHYAMESDAVRAIEKLKTTKFQGRKLKAELAMRKSVKMDTDILAAELPKAQQKRTAEIGRAHV